VTKVTKAEQVAAGDAARAEHRPRVPYRRADVSAGHPGQRRPQPGDGLLGDVLRSGQRAGHKVDDLGGGRVDAGVAQGSHDPLPPGMTSPAADDHPSGPEGTHGRGQA
jgi:hypothetical protein